MSARTELTLQEITESWWFRLAARSAAIVGWVLATIVAPTIGGYALWMASRVQALETDRTTLSAQIVEIGKQGGEIADGLSDIRAILDAVRVDLALTKGIVTEMQRQDTVAATRSDLKFARGGVTTVARSAGPPPTD